MVDIGAAEAIPPAEVEDVELYHSKSWVTKYVFCQDAKVIAIQYSITAIVHRNGGAGAVMADAPATGVPGHVLAYRSEQILQLITMHGMIMVIYLLTALFLGGFGNYLIPLMVGARDMVFPYVNMLSYWVYLLAVVVLVSTLFRARRAHRRRLDAVSTSGDSLRHPRAAIGASFSCWPL